MISTKGYPSSLFGRCMISSVGKRLTYLGTFQKMVGKIYISSLTVRRGIIAPPASSISGHKISGKTKTGKKFGKKLR